MNASPSSDAPSGDPSIEVHQFDGHNSYLHTGRVRPEDGARAALPSPASAPRLTADQIDEASAQVSREYMEGRPASAEAGDWKPWPPQLRKEEKCWVWYRDRTNYAHLAKPIALLVKHNMARLIIQTSDMWNEPFDLATAEYIRIEYPDHASQSQSQSKAEAVGAELTVKKSRQQLARSLRWLANLVQQGDSDEATISFEVGDGDYFDVASSFHYRAGKGLNYSWRFGPGDVDEPRPPATQNPPENARVDAAAAELISSGARMSRDDVGAILFRYFGNPPENAKGELAKMVRRIGYPGAGSVDEFATINHFASEIQVTWTLEELEAMQTQPTPSTREEGRT